MAHFVLNIIICCCAMHIKFSKLYNMVHEVDDFIKKRAYRFFFSVVVKLEIFSEIIFLSL